MPKNIVICADGTGNTTVKGRGFYSAFWHSARARLNGSPVNPVTLRVAACFAVVSAWGIAAQRVDAIPQVPAGATRVTVKETEKAIDKAAAERQIPLSEAAKTVLAVEVVRQNMAKEGNVPAASTPDVKIQEVLTSVTDRPSTGEITADQATVMV